MFMSEGTVGVMKAQKTVIHAIWHGHNFWKIIHDKLHTVALYSFKIVSPFLCTALINEPYPQWRQKINGCYSRGTCIKFVWATIGTKNFDQSKKENIEFLTHRYGHKVTDRTTT